jgi:hypothetical protein
MLTMNLEFKSPAHNVLSDVVSVMRNVELVALFIAIFVLGKRLHVRDKLVFTLHKTRLTVTIGTTAIHFQRNYRYSLEAPDVGVQHLESLGLRILSIVQNSK